MKKDIKDYLHLYLGCGCQTTWQGNTFQPYGVINIEKLYQVMVELIKEIKPILRPLSDMTEEEKLELYKVFAWSYYSDDIGRISGIDTLFADNGYYNKQTNITGNQWNKAINYCRSIGIDMDGLISDGLAIDKTKLI